MKVPVRWLPVLAFAVLASPLLLAGSSQATPGEVVAGSDPVALGLLRAAVSAETDLTYGGVEVVSGEDAADSDDAADDVVDVSHVAGQGTVLESQGSGNGTRAGFVGADVRRPDLLVDLLQRSYRIVLAGTDTVAGRPATVVEAQRPDGQVAARFWLDDATGLLLRRDLIDASGRTSASLAFQAVSMTGEPVAYLPPLLPSVRAAALDRTALAGWAARGWPCRDQVGGLTLFDARTVTGSASVLHLSYSDGLSTVSVFVQRGRVDADDVPGARRAGVAGQPVFVLAGHPRQLVWSADGYVFTVVADADKDVVADVVADLPHSSPPPSGWGRVERGLSRVVSWVDPFD